jgi:hypothetical protein
MIMIPLFAYGDLTSKNADPYAKPLVEPRLLLTEERARQLVTMLNGVLAARCDSKPLAQKESERREWLQSLEPRMTEILDNALPAGTVIDPDELHTDIGLAREEYRRGKKS